MQLEQRLFKSSCVAVESNIRDALESLSISGIGIVLLLDSDGILTGVLTDGDCRRALLDGAGLDHPLQDIMVTSYSSVTPNEDRATVLELMRSLSIEHLPILDSGGKPVGVHLIREMLSSQVLPNSAVIFAGGLGQRLKPVTEHIPKPMVKVAGRPILERTILQLSGQGVKNIYLAVNYLKDIIEDYFGDGSEHGCNISYLHEDSPLGTAGALALLPEKPKLPVIVMNGDIIAHFSVAGMLDLQREAKADVVIGFREYVHRVPYGCLKIENERVKKIDEKPDLVEDVNAGVYVLSPDVWESFPEGAFSMTELFDILLDQDANLVPFQLDENWVDVGTPIDLNRANGNI